MRFTNSISHSNEAYHSLCIDKGSRLEAFCKMIILKI